MSKGFFAGSQLVSKAPVGTIPKCGACGLHKKCISPKMEVSGDGKMGIFVLGEAPGEAEDTDGVQFVGRSGQYLRKVLANHGVDLDTDCWKSNAIICRPKDNRTPSENEIDYCRPNLMNTIAELKPTTFIVLGGAAVRALIGSIWREAPGPVGRWQGWSIPCQKHNAWIHPTFHPSYCLREDDKVIDKMFERAIEAAVNHDGRPFEVVPDERAEVELIHDPSKAARIIRQMIKKGGAVAFDYETNMLKPDSAEALIVSCSVCWRGRKTIAYPWHGDAIAATRELLRSPLPKIASNLKFEERWTRSILKTRVRNWVWDTMIAAHVLDNRPGITSIKFQSFVHLGSDIWDDHIQQFLHTKGQDSDVNQILEQVDLDDLLLYNGLDSLLEYRVAEKQMSLLRYPKPKGM